MHGVWITMNFKKMSWAFTRLWNNSDDQQVMLMPTLADLLTVNLSCRLLNGNVKWVGNQCIVSEWVSQYHS